MKILIDTNVLVSAILNQNSAPMQAIIITGDKDFLESGIDKPKILTARDFIDQFVDENN